MSLTIPDEVLAQSGLSERDARIEIACRLYAAGRFTRRAAMSLSALSGPEFEDALTDRSLPIHDVTIDDLRRDVDNLKQAGV